MDINTQPNYLDSSDGNQHDIQILAMDGLEQIKNGKQNVLMKYVTDWRKSILMRRYNIEITELAEQDLEDIGDYIAFVLMNTNKHI